MDTSRAWEVSQVGSGDRAEEGGWCSLRVDSVQDGGASKEWDIGKGERVQLGAS